MYIPKQFAAPSAEATVEIMQQHNFAVLSSIDASGEQVATHLPIIVSAEGKTLHFHFAGMNPQVAALRANPKALVIFMGPHAYMSPSVYADLKRVPTWNYIAVHAYGTVTEITEPAEKDALLKSLIAIHEPHYAEQWRGLDASFQESMLGAIAAFKMEVTQLDSKFKLNQHRKEAHAAMKAGYSKGTPDEQALGQWMERLGL